MGDFWERLLFEFKWIILAFLKSRNDYTATFAVNFFAFSIKNGKCHSFSKYGLPRFAQLRSLAMTKA